MKLWESLTLARKLGHFNEGAALDLLDVARDRLKLKPSTCKMLREAIADHFDQTADTLRDPKAALDFCADGQAPPRPVTEAPPALSDMGFELDSPGAADYWLTKRWVSVSTQEPCLTPEQLDLLLKRLSAEGER